MALDVILAVSVYCTVTLPTAWTKVAEKPNELVSVGAAVKVDVTGTRGPSSLYASMPICGAIMEVPCPILKTGQISENDRDVTILFLEEIR
jgi:hypothetical protein